ncbi:MAG TPA: carbon-nitrogen hydrolase family protein, partial [Candidatus Glassbacteria bacterium]|nr:carbon-nitrogen hydrolase family protein [Candidatus Glassbacteria bacterium]
MIGSNNGFGKFLQRTASLLAALIVFCGLIGQPAAASAGPPGTILFEQDSFSGDGDEVAGWGTWSQRQETRPRFFTAELPNLGGAGSLVINGASNNSAHGCWQKKIVGIKPGAWYRVEAWFLANGVPYLRQQVLSRLDWHTAEDGRAGQPEYVQETGGDGQWHQNSGFFQAPKDAEAVVIELYLSYCPQGTVWWDKVSFSQVPDPEKRMVRVAAINCYPRELGSSEASVNAYIPQLDEAGRNGCDIACIGEGINLAGVGTPGVKYPDIAEPIPGPTTEMLGEVARRHKMYIVGAMGERDGHAVYNTAVLIDRQGRVAGKYRKVYLPREEIEAGCTPGDDYPVFDTDFGRIGMMICWDLQYADPARALAVQGAEIVFCPIWGGNAVLAQARAIENQVYLVTSAYSDLPTAIYGHWGEILAKADKRPSVAWKDLDLNQRFPDEWLGDMRNRF